MKLVRTNDFTKWINVEQICSLELRTETIDHDFQRPTTSKRWWVKMSDGVSHMLPYQIETFAQALRHLRGENILALMAEEQQP